MQQPPDPGIPGHAAEAAEYAQVNPATQPRTAAGAPNGHAPVAGPGTQIDHRSHIGPGSPAGFAMTADAMDTSDIGGDVDAFGASATAGAGSSPANSTGSANTAAASVAAGPSVAGPSATGPSITGPSIADADDVGYRGPTACHAAGISYRQLDYWARTGLVVPSVRDASGSGSQRLYSFRDIVVLKVVKRLLDAGVSLQNIRKAIDTLRSRGVGDLAGITLISDGTTVYECRSPEEVVDLLQGGQGVFGIAISGAFKEIEGTLSHLPAEAATPGEEVPAPPATGSAEDTYTGGDELAMRRARRRAG
nr:hypothetical protein GCM10020063_012750 [Dactylosporangium thailandense]